MLGQAWRECLSGGERGPRAEISGGLVSWRPARGSGTETQCVACSGHAGAGGGSGKGVGP